jgi:hypothetical protein
MQDISFLKDAHRGRNVYVVGGGKSLDYYPKDFFKNKIVLAVNQASRIVPATYIVRKEFSGHSDVPVIASRYVAGCIDAPENKADYIFEHRHNKLSTIDIAGCHPLGNKIIVSWSTITSAIHLAAFMGASNIFLVGHDCATLDGEQTAYGYYDGVSRLTGEQSYDKWLSQIAPQTEYLRDYLQKWYKIPLVSLSPFIGLNNEGHLVK